MNALYKLVHLLPQTKNGKLILEGISQAIHEKGLSPSLDGAAIQLAFHSLPQTIRPTSNKVWHHGDPLHPSNSSLLVKVLKEGSGQEDTIKHLGDSTGRPHFIWTMILQRYLEPIGATIKFETLWNNVVESISFV